MKTLTLAECMNIYGGCYIYSSNSDPDRFITRCANDFNKPILHNY